MSCFAFASGVLMNMLTYLRYPETPFTDQIGSLPLDTPFK